PPRLPGWSAVCRPAPNHRVTGTLGVGSRSISNLYLTTPRLRWARPSGATSSELEYESSLHLIASAGLVPMVLTLNSFEFCRALFLSVSAIFDLAIFGTRKTPARTVGHDMSGDSLQ